MLNCDNEKNNNGNKVWKAKIDFVKIPDKTKSIIASEYKFDMANMSICTNSYKRNQNKGYLQTPVFVSMYSDWFSKNADIYGEDLSGIENAKDIMRDFVRLYRTVCDIRNNANHSNNGIKAETITKKLKELNDVLKTIKQQSLSGTNYSFYTDEKFT